MLCCLNPDIQNSVDFFVDSEYLYGRELALIEVSVRENEEESATLIPSSWREHDERKGYLVSDDLLSWRRAYFAQKGQQLGNSILQTLGTFEYHLRLSLYPSLDEIDCRASELSGALLGAYRRIKRLEWSFLNIVIHKLCHHYSEPINAYITEMTHKLRNLVSFVEYFYDSMANHIKIYDEKPWWSSLDCFFCCHQRGEYEQQLLSLKQSHMSRLDLAELLTTLQNIKNHGGYSSNHSYGATSAGDTMEMPLVVDF